MNIDDGRTERHRDNILKKKKKKIHPAEKNTEKKRDQLNAAGLLKNKKKALQSS